MKPLVETYRSLLLVLSLLLAGGCGSVYYGAEADDGLVAASRSMAPAEQRLLIKTAEIEVEVSDPAETMETIEKHFDGSGGYVESSTVWSEEKVYMKVRVPSERLDAFLDFVGGLGDETERSIRSYDVTEQYVDIEARLKNMRALRDRLREVLAKAEDVHDIVSVESKLGDVQAELDALEARMKSLKSKIALSEVDITIRERRILGPLGFIGYGILWVIEKLFVISG